MRVTKPGEDGWANFMAGALQGEPVLNFTPPEGVVFAMIDPKTGLLGLSKTPDAYLESFVKGTEPKDYYPPQENIPEDKVVNEVPPDEEGF
jgi:membrane carboxypeptidase/penicillin-binding protein